MTDGCIKWDGYRTRRGYGQAQLAPGEHPRGLRQTLAHRKVMADILGWSAVDGMVVMHLCDNPSCVNPSHLKIGTQEENIHDCIQKRRFKQGFSSGHKRTRGEKNSMAKLTEASAQEIRSRRANGERVDSLAREYGVHRNTIYRIASQKAWRFTT